METDQYLCLDVEVEDSADLLNQRINEVMRGRLATLNRKYSARRRERMACEDVARYSLKRFSRPLYSRVAKWTHQNPEIDQYPEPGTGRKEYYRQSVLGVPYYYHLQIPLGRTVNVGGVYLGVDKLGHFFSFGAKYHRRYLRGLSKGMSEEEATRRAILWGLRQEKGIVGGGTTGITSFADLEANYQGLRLMQNLCSEDGPTRLTLGADSQWMLQGDLDLRDYVNPDWDESFNPNFYIKRRWKHIKRRIVRHCDKLEDPVVARRFERYEAGYEPSLNQRIMQSLENAGKLPARRRFLLASVCADRGESSVTARASTASESASTAAPER